MALLSRLVSTQAIFSLSILFVGDGGDEGGLRYVELVELGDMFVSMPTTTALTLRILSLWVSPSEDTSGGVYTKYEAIVKR